MSFEVRVPASSANLGPGFDSLAVALSLYMRVTVKPDAETQKPPSTIDLMGGEDLMLRGIERAAEILGRPTPMVALRSETDIPVARGLGSSAAAIVAGLQIGAMLCGECEPSDEFLIEAGGAMEGHADNISAAVLGGVTAAIKTETGYRAAQLATHLPWSVVLFVPDGAAFTNDARGVLPSDVAISDATANVGRTALLVQAIREGDGELVSLAMDDRLHQPYRAELFPHLMPLIEHGRAAGAVGGCLSGAGPSVLLLAPPERASTVRDRIIATAAEIGISGSVSMPEVDRRGVVVNRDPEKSPPS